MWKCLERRIEPLANSNPSARLMKLTVSLKVWRAAIGCMGEKQKKYMQARLKRIKARSGINFQTFIACSS
jgi:hypothetical protein